MSGALLVTLLAFTCSGASSPSPAASAPETATTTGPSATKRLNLGRPGVPVEDLMAPRFSAEVEVWARAPRDLDQTMAVWWDHFNITAPAIYGRGTAFRQPPPPGSVDITPLVEWVAKKVKNRKRE